jgi:GDP-D-mannose 3',5'-epimerase
MAKDGEEIEVWGDGLATRSFLYIDECIEGVRRLMRSELKEPVNIGSEEMVSVNQLAQMIIDISGKDLKIRNVPTSVQGVRGRNSDNNMLRRELKWEPTMTLRAGLEKTYAWVNEQVNK